MNYEIFKAAVTVAVLAAAFLLLCATIGIQLMELDAYGDLQPLIQKITGK